MTDVALFLFGCLVTLICAGAIGLFLYGAYQDGLEDKPKDS
jgi:hypothetical protein